MLPHAAEDFFSIARDLGALPWKQSERSCLNPEARSKWISCLGVLEHLHRFSVILVMDFASGDLLFEVYQLDKVLSKASVGRACFGRQHPVQ
jgi:hypothetical protein